MNKEFLDRWPSGKGEGWMILLNGKVSPFGFFSAVHPNNKIEVVACTITNTVGCANGLGQVHFRNESKYMWMQDIYDSPYDAIEYLRLSFGKCQENIDKIIQQLQNDKLNAHIMFNNIKVGE